MNMRNVRRKATAAAVLVGTGMVAAPLVATGTAYAAQSGTNPTITVTHAPTVEAGQTASGPTLSFTLSSGFTSGSYILLDLPAATTNANGVTFAGTPTVSVTGAPSGTAEPTITATEQHNSADTSSFFTGTDQLKITMGTTESSANSYTVTIGGLKIAAGSSAAGGSISGSETYSSASTGVTTSATSVSGLATVLPSTASSVTPMPFQVGSTTAVKLPSVSFTADSTSAFPTGTYTYTVATASGTLGGTPSVTVDTASGATATTVSRTGNVVTFTLTAGSAAPTITISGLTLTPASSLPASFAAATAKLSNAALSSPTVAETNYGGDTMLKPAIAGATANATAAATFNHYPNAAANSGVTSAVLATNITYPDALSASYFAAKQGTGILLTGKRSLSTSAEGVLVNSHINTVYVVGGPLAISDSVVSQVEAIHNAGTPSGSGINVIRLYGQTAYDTNQAILNFAQSQGGFAPSFNLSAAYANESAYNDTTGTESASTTAPGSVPTAIVASGMNFQDALAASPLAAGKHIPVILTDPSSLSSTAQGLLGSFGIKQVILMGGQLAMSNSVESQIAGMGISVLRVAGIDYTDTAQRLATLETSSIFGFGTQTINVARGNGFPDALTASPYLGSTSSPLFLVLNPSTVGSYLPGYLATSGADAIQPFGGPLAINSSVLTSINNDLAAQG